jgi:hypothetical protein
MTTFFVICPIGDDGSDERKHSNLVFKHIIKPAVNKATNQDPAKCVIRADYIDQPGEINAQVFDKLRTTDVVIANLYNHNANVMFELGLRYGTQKPFVLLCQEGQKPPFDLAGFRIVFYKLDDLDKVEAACSELSSHISSVIGGVFMQLETQKEISKFQNEITMLHRLFDKANTEKDINESKIRALVMVAEALLGPLSPVLT